MSEVADMQSRYFKVCFSSLFRESLSFLPTYVGNFLEHVECGFLMVNLPRDVYEKAVRLPEFARQEHASRVRLVCAHGPRHAFGSGLLLAHLYNFSLARQTQDFDYFCAVASNAIFFRRFNLMECIQVMNREKKVPTVPVTTEDRSGNWPKILGSKPLLEFMNAQGYEKFCCNQIEGMISSVANWEKVAARQSLFAEIEVNFADDKMRFPVEEVLPGTIIANEGDGRFTHICWNHWERVPCGGKVRFDDLLQLPNRRYSPQTVAVKWVDRDAQSPLTLALTDRDMHKQFRSVADAVKASSPTSLIAYHHLFDAAAKNIRIQFQSKSLICAPRFSTDGLFEFEGPVDRRCFALWPNEKSPEFLFLEQFDKVSAQFTIRVTADCVSIDWHSGDLTSLPTDVWRHRRIAYFYIPLPELSLPAGTCLELTVARTSGTAGTTETTVMPSGQDNPAVLDGLAFTNRYGRLVTHDHGRYEAVNLDHGTALDEGNQWRLYFHLSAAMQSDSTQRAHIGLPVVAGDNVSYSLNAWIPKPQQ